MKRACLFLLLLAWAFIGCCPVARAQFDPNCYYPRIGVPGEIDTIYGGMDGQGLGGNQFSIGPGPNSPYNRIFMGGYPNNLAGWDILSSGPTFNLYDLNPPKSNFFKVGSLFQGHFHTPQLTDILWIKGGLPWIYWADMNGNYDSSRRTVLRYRSRPGLPNGAYNYNVITPFIARMTSDTLDDIVLCCATSIEGGLDSQFVVLYQGGSSLYSSSDTVMNDEAAYLDDSIDFNKGYSTRYGKIGDFRGTGRQDYIGYGVPGNLFYFRNDPPFSLSKFADAMVHDTLYAPWQNPSVPAVPITQAYWQMAAVKAFPKSKSDPSVDFVGGLSRIDDPNGSYSANFFRGGPDFGSHRLTAKDTDLCIRNPIDNIGFGGRPIPCGDMTGTGNPVIAVGGGEPGFSYCFFYVMGEAADQYVDMEYGQYYGGGPLDTLTADGDLLEDVINGNSFYRTEGGTEAGVGTIEIIHGSRKIPVRLNPRFAKVTDAVRTGDSLRIAPNPCSTHTIVTWESSCSGAVELQLYDVMGRQVYEERRPTTGTLESFSLDLPKLPNGEYFLVLIQEPCVQHARIIIQQ